MTSPRWARDIGGTRWYAHPTKHERQPVWRGVTGTIAALPKEAIPRWAAKSVAEYAFDHYDEWSKLPRDDWYDEPGPEMADWPKNLVREMTRHRGAIYMMKNKPWEIRDRAAARGSEVHAVVEKMVAGEDYSLEASTFPWVASAAEFVDRCRPRARLSEVTVYNDEHLYAGSVDAEGCFAAFPELGDDVLWDYKTGRGVYDDMAVQLVAYAKGEYYLDDDDREQPWPQPSAAVIVHLGPEGFKLYRSPLKKILWHTFLAALQIRNWEDVGPKLEEIPTDISEEEMEEEGEPFWDEVWRAQKEQEWADALAALEVDRTLELTLALAERGLPRAVAAMTDEQLDEAVGLLAPSRAPQSGRPAQRPMP